MKWKFYGNGDEATMDHDSGEMGNKLNELYKDHHSLP